MENIYGNPSSAITRTPRPPYFAVIFTSLRTPHEYGYEATADQMSMLAQLQPGYLGHESAREGIGNTVSYWDSLEAIRNWKQQADHIQAQLTGRTLWYDAYKVRICLVERDYAFDSDSSSHSDDSISYITENLHS